jgi:hypothetical protein
VSRATRRSRSLGKGLRPVASPVCRRAATPAFAGAGYGLPRPDTDGEGWHPIHPHLCAYDRGFAGYLASGRLGEEASPRPRIYRRRVTADVAALLQALVDFNRADTLLNQAVRALNTLALFAEDHGSARLLTEVRELRRTLDQLRDKFDVPVAAIQAALGDDREG